MTSCKVWMYDPVRIYGFGFDSSLPVMSEGNLLSFTWKDFNYLHHLMIDKWPGETIWWHRSISTKVMACCLQWHQSHYLNQCWLITKYVLWHSHESTFINSFENVSWDYTFKSLLHLPGAKELKAFQYFHVIGIPGIPIKTSYLKTQTDHTIFIAYWGQPHRHRTIPSMSLIVLQGHNRRLNNWKSYKT